MSRDLLEEGPRLEVRFSEDELTKLLEGLADADYEDVPQRSPNPTGEYRRRHAGGSVVRIFPGPGLLYVYPPGGTRRPTGPITPFSPLKAACDAANRRLPSAQEEAGSPAGGDSGTTAGNADAADPSAGTGDPATSTGSDDADDE